MVPVLLLYKYSIKSLRSLRRKALLDNGTLASAESSDLFGHNQMLFTCTFIVGIDPCFQFSGTQQPVRFRDGPLAMDPFRFNRVEPRTFARQVADDDAHARGTPLDLLIVLTEPVPHGLVAGPRGIVPDQQQGGAALHGELGRAPGQKIDRHRTHGAPGHKPEPHLVSLQQPWPQQQAITGQRFGIRIVRGPAQLLQLVCGCGVRPAMLVGLREATPPDLVAKAQRPGWMGHRPLDQLVAPFFFRAYAGAGLVIQCLARFHDTRKRRRATRMASSLTSRGVSPWAELTSAASARVHRLVGLPNVRGL